MNGYAKLNSPWASLLLGAGSKRLRTLFSIQQHQYAVDLTFFIAATRESEFPLKQDPLVIRWSIITTTKRKCIILLRTCIIYSRGMTVWLRLSSYPFRISLNYTRNNHKRLTGRAFISLSGVYLQSRLPRSTKSLLHSLIHSINIYWANSIFQGTVLRTKAHFSCFNDLICSQNKGRYGSRQKNIIKIRCVITVTELCLRNSVTQRRTWLVLIQGRMQLNKTSWEACLLLILLSTVGESQYVFRFLFFLVNKEGINPIVSNS